MSLFDIDDYDRGCEGSDDGEVHGGNGDGM